MAVLLLLGLIALAAGVFGLGLGAPARDTMFGAAVLVSSSVAVTGGVILLGLAAAVSELRRALQAGMRQMRPPERFEGAERGARRTEPRLAAAPATHGGVAGGTSGPAFGGGIAGGPPGADAADVIPTRFDAPEVVERLRQPAQDRPPSLDAGHVPPPPAFQPAAGGESRWTHVPPPAPERLQPDRSERLAPPERLAPERQAPERLDAIRPADYRKADQPGPDQQHPGVPTPPPFPAATGAGDVNVPPPLPEAGAASRPVRILKSGTFNDVSYTLFSDGSIETQTPDGTLRFSSIDEFRRHLDKIA